MGESANSGVWRLVARGLPVVCFAGAVYFWFCHVAQGIAYGDLFGVPGREGDVAAMASHARECLGIALVLEALAIGMTAWLLSDEVEPLWHRLCFCVVIASVLDFGTFAVVRGF